MGTRSVLWFSVDCLKVSAVVLPGCYMNIVFLFIRVLNIVTLCSGVPIKAHYFEFMNRDF